MKDILLIGEALVDIVIPTDGPTAEHPGGSPLNVAVGLGRLGHQVDLVTRVGTDARGERVAEHLAASGVRLFPGSVVEGSSTSTGTAFLNPDGVARYEFDLVWDLPDDLTIGTPDAVHTGSIGAAVHPGADDVLRLIKTVAGKSIVSYDPNARPHLMGEASEALAWMEQIVQLSDVVKVSDEDLAWLLPGQDPLAVAERWRQLGPPLVVVTRGPHGASGVVEGGVVEVAAPPITVADTVGAGDAFMSGLLDALAGAGLLEPSGRDTLRAMSPTGLVPLISHAVKVSAYTCTRPGADPPTREQLDAWQG